jgi:hypothetical protein
MTAIESVREPDRLDDHQTRQRKTRLRRIARFANWIALLALLLVLGCETYLAIHPEAMVSDPKLVERLHGATIGAWGHTALWLASFVPAALFMAAMANAMGLFRQLGRGEMFHPAIPTRLGYLGGLSIAASIADILAKTALVAVVGLSATDRSLDLSISLQMDEMSAFVLGLLLLALALIMREALAIDEENRSIV